MWIILITFPEVLTLIDWEGGNDLKGGEILSIGFPNVEIKKSLEAVRWDFFFVSVWVPFCAALYI